MTVSAPNEYAGKLAMVTAASRGIGRACASALAAVGMRVIAVARTENDLQSLVKLGHGRIESWQCDVSSDIFIERLNALSELDVLVNNIGINFPRAIEDVDLATLDVMLALNVRAVFRTSQAAVRVMRKGKRGGSIIHMSSQMGHVGAANRTVYCMTKHAIEGLTKAMAVELGGAGIRVNSVAPTFIETDLTRPMLADPAFSRSVLESIPIGRIGQPEDVAAAVLFLASAGSGMVTGHSLKVDGGWTAQ